uniref:Uncharacterized protein n=1 Tax=Lutzomyia longipalpis TaxID=7200 RepID=A0A1B0GI58_LUTLO
MRFLINCCSCIEGRMAMTRQGLLEHISQFHPHVTRLQRSHTAVIEEWLTFYEILTRYPEGRAAKYLTVLTALIQQSNVGIRRKAVEILRNFAMDSANTAALLSSEDFMRTVKMILDGSDREDQLNASVAIWSMIANNTRAKNAIKSTSIPGKLQAIQNNLILAGNTEGNHLYSSMENISKILMV